MGIATFSLVAMDSRDPKRLMAFYAELLGWAEDSGNEGHGWCQLISPAGATLAFQLAPDHVAPAWPEGGSVQRHLDFDVPDIDGAEPKVLALGATKASKQPGEEHNDSWRVYLDPDGHPFCLVRSQST
jgi:predicted enzyme related to lactoylglutathione lyase